MMGDAEKASEMIRTRGLGTQIHQNMSSPDYLRAVQDCHPDSPASQWLYMLSDAGLAYEGRAIGTGLIVLTFYFPNMLLNAMRSVAAFLPVVAQAGWLRFVSCLRFGLWGVGIYVVYELSRMGYEAYLNHRDPARPVLIAMQRSLDAAVAAEKNRIRQLFLTEYNELHRKLSRRGPTFAEREILRHRYLVLRDALRKLADQPS